MTDIHDSGRDSPRDTWRSAYPAVTERLRRNWWVMLILGILLVLGGTAAIVLPITASLAVTIAVGAALAVSGVFKAVHAFRCEGWRCRGWEMASAVLYVIGGLFLLFNPLAGMVSLTIIMIMLIGADAVLRMIMAFRIRPDRGWGWLMAGGVAGLLLAVAMLVMLPGISLTALGLLAGIALIFEGWGFVALALAARREGETGSEAAA